jgi:hypothetical protein
MAISKIKSNSIADDAITSDKVADGVISAADVADGTLTNAKLQNSSVTINGSAVALGGSTTIETGTSWQSSIFVADGSTGLTVEAGKGYWIDTTSGTVTVTLPGSATVGDTIEFSDYARTWGTNNVTINTNSLNFQGNSSPNPVYNTNGQSVKIIYSGATQGWIPSVDDDVTLETPQTYNAEYLVVAGGGSGAGGNGGGGGAGGYLTNYGGTAIGLSPGETYTVTVGAGGSGVTGNPKVHGNDGSDSVLSGTGISTVTAFGGGGPGTTTDPLRDGNDGGSGGGAGGGGTAGSGTVGQGNDGGAHAPGGGGGGGAGEAGSTDGVGYGGDGLSNSITGSATFYAGGGGGGYSPSPGTFPGGDGGGGTGKENPNPGVAGTANTGGGGGGCNDSPAPAGGSGVVILRVPTADYTGTTTGSPTVTTDGTDTVIKFTGSGSYTA